MDKRIHKALRVEELEPRVAPVTLTASNPTYSFTDADGDLVLLQYSGPGQAHVMFYMGPDEPYWGDPEIQYILVSGSTSASKLTIQDMDPGKGGDTLEWWDISTGTGESFGNIQALAGAGSVYGGVTISKDLGTLNVQGDCDILDVNVGGDLGTFHVGGELKGWSYLRIGGKVNSFVIDKNVGSDNHIEIGGDAPNVQLKGNFTGSELMIAGAAYSVKITGAVSKSIIATPDLKYLSAGSLADTIVVGGASIGSVYCMGNMNSTMIATNGNVDTLYINGNVAGGLNGWPVLNIGGNVKSLTITGDLKEAGLSIFGDVGTAKVQGATHAAAINIEGNLSLGTFGKAVTWSAIGVWKTATTLQFNDTVKASVVGVNDKVGTFKIAKGLNGSCLWLAGGADNVTLDGQVYQSLVGIGGTSLKTLSITGGIAGSHVSVGAASAPCSVGTVSVTGGLDMGSSLNIAGDVNLFKVAGGVYGNSTVNVLGQVTTAQITGNGTSGISAIKAGSTVTFGSLKTSLLITGGLAGTMDITGSAAGANITLNGDLSGSLLAGVFGNVTVNGNFSGQIGDAGTAAGSGNTLKITGSSFGGAVNPWNAFSKYIGYP